MTRPFFSIDRISHFDIFDRHAESVIALMKERFHAGLAVDFQVRALARVCLHVHLFLHTRMSFPVSRLIPHLNSCLGIA